MPKPNVFRQLALAKALADGMSPREIARKFAGEWQVQRDSVHVMLKKLLGTWASQQPREYTSISPWERTSLTIDRMHQLRAALSTCEARGSIVRRYAQLWELHASYVDQLITRLLDEDQHDLLRESEAQRLRYVARIRSTLARYAELKDHALSSRAYERILRLSKP